MIRHSAYRFELDPNNCTRTLLFKHAGVARFAWNWSLARRIERFNTQEGKEKFTDSMKEHKVLVSLKGTEFPWMYEVSKCAPQEALRNLDKAFKNFWSRRKEGVGFPKFKKKNGSRDSFTLNGIVKVLDRHIQLPRIGKVRVKDKIDGRVKGRILSATVSRTADRWFVSILTEQDLPEPQPVQGPAVGLDLGIKSFAVCSCQNELTKVNSPKPLRSALKKLARAQRAHSRKKKGSNNSKKSSLRVSKIHARVTSIRQDFLHKLSTSLTKTKSTIVIEDLNVRGMVKNRHLSRSIADQGWGEFRRQLEYKSKWYGSTVVVADRWFASSKICSSCGIKREKLALAEREWTCSCGYVHDRDENAAKNLESLAYRGFPGIVPVREKACGVGSAGSACEGVMKLPTGKQEANSGARESLA